MANDSSIPVVLQPQAQAALAWVNQSQRQNFELTGLVDYERALTADADAPVEFGLILCNGEICTREQVRVQPVAEGFEVSSVAQAAREIPPLLDPPEGIRSNWLATELGKHEFVLLLFYRGLW